MWVGLIPSLIFVPFSYFAFFHFLKVSFNFNFWSMLSGIFLATLEFHCCLALQEGIHWRACITSENSSSKCCPVFGCCNPKHSNDDCHRIFTQGLFYSAVTIARQTLYWWLVVVLLNFSSESIVFHHFVLGDIDLIVYNWHYLSSSIKVLMLLLVITCREISVHIWSKRVH